MDEQTTQELAEQFETEPETITKAVDSGWRPPDEFKGNEENFRDPAEWVKRTEEYVPFIKTQMKGLEEKVGNLEKENQTLKQTIEATQGEIKEKDRVMKKVLDAHDNISKREYENALTTIRKQQREAVENSDGEAWEKLEAEKDNLKAPETIAPKEPSGTPDAPPEFVEWKKENTWFDEEIKDPLSSYAVGIQEHLLRSGYKGKDLLNKITEEVKLRFPDKFENPNRNNPGDVDSGSTSGAGDTNLNKQTYANLPEDAKAACKSLVKQGIITKEQYVKEYYEV